MGNSKIGGYPFWGQHKKDYSFGVYIGVPSFWETTIIWRARRKMEPDGGDGPIVVNTNKKKSWRQTWKVWGT